MKYLSIEEFEVMLCSTGYLPPRNEDELTFFEQMYEGYKSKLAGRHVDIEAIINGLCPIEDKGTVDYDFSERTTSSAGESNDLHYSIAARNYNNLPKDILEKMKRQHNADDNNED